MAPLPASLLCRAARHAIMRAVSSERPSMERLGRLSRQQVVGTDANQPISREPRFAPAAHDPLVGSLPRARWKDPEHLPSTQFGISRKLGRTLRGPRAPEIATTMRGNVAELVLECGQKSRRQPPLTISAELGQLVPQSDDHARDRGAVRVTAPRQPVFDYNGRREGHRSSLESYHVGGVQHQRQRR
jgi:hypothetical protein